MNKYIKPTIFITFIIIFVLLDRYFHITSKLFIDLSYLQKIVEVNYVLSLVIYSMLTIISCVLFALPGVTFAIAAAYLFGPYVGTLICLFSTTIGSILSFLAGRYFMKDLLKNKIMRNKHLRKLLFEQSSKNEIKILLITRVLPLFPFNLQNYAYGITDISLLKYSTCTFIFMLPGVAMFTFGSAGIISEESRKLYFTIFILLLLLVFIISYFVNKVYGTESNN